MILTTEAVVLKTMKYRESSVIATLYTREQGKVSIIAKGARGKSRVFGASLEIMNRVHAVLYTKPTRDLQLLTRCEHVHPFRGISENLRKMGLGMAMVELANLATPADERNIRLYELLVDGLESLNNATRWYENALYFYEVHLLEVLGFRPDMDRCSACGLPVDACVPTGGAARFSASPAGFLCAECGTIASGDMTVAPACLKALGRMQGMQTAGEALRVALSTEMKSEIGQLLRTLVYHHITGMRPLRSEQVFAMLE